MKQILIILILAIFISIPPIMDAQDKYTAQLMVIGEGDELYFWWWHVGIFIIDNFTGNAVIYDYGHFDFKDKNFYLNFLFGNLYFDSIKVKAKYYINTMKKKIEIYLF